MLLLKLLYTITGPIGIYDTAINSHAKMTLEMNARVMLLCVFVCVCVRARVLKTSPNNHDPLKSLATS